MYGLCACLWIVKSCTGLNWYANIWPHIHKCKFQYMWVCVSLAIACVNKCVVCVRGILVHMHVVFFAGLYTYNTHVPVEYLECEHVLNTDEHFTCKIWLWCACVHMSMSRVCSCLHISLPIFAHLIIYIIKYVFFDWACKGSTIASPVLAGLSRWAGEITLQ